MAAQEYLTTEAYAELHDIDVQVVRYHCRNDNLDHELIASSGHGTFLIPSNAVIVLNKTGPKAGKAAKIHDYF